METLHTKIKFWNGLRTIGGTIISVEYGSSRVIFDFGLTYSPAESFSGVVKTRYNALVEDYINLNIIPAIDGLYSRKALRNLVNIIPAEDDDRNSEVVISHLHLDHIGAMGLIAPNIPVYLTEESLRFYKAIEEIGEGVYGDRRYSSLSYSEDLVVGDIKVTAVPVDHDIFGACGFFIETPDLRIVYSGDLRIHGKHPELTNEFSSKANSFKPNLLIMEGTMINGEKKSRETKPSAELKGIVVEGQIKQIISGKLERISGLAVINVSERNLERIVDILQASEELGRKAVLEPETAYLIEKLTDIRNFYIYKSEELETRLADKSATEWIEKLTDKYKTVSYYDINLSPKDYLLQNSFKNLMELLDLNLTRGVYIHSNAMPLGAYDPDWQKLQEFLKKLKVDYEYIGSPGHAFHSHLKYIIDEIKPEILIPVHSSYPEKLYPESKKQFLPEYGMEYMIKNGKIIGIK